MPIRSALLSMVLAVSSVATSGASSSADTPSPPKRNPENRRPKQDDAAHRGTSPPRPILVMLRQEHWIGEETTFALYDDGRVIYAPKKDQDGVGRTLVSGYSSVVLNAKEFRELRQIIDEADLFSLNDSYKLSNLNGKPTTTFFTWKDENLKQCYVYGQLRGPGKSSKKPPKGFMDLFKKVADFEHDKAKRWMPNCVEVLLGQMEWDYPVFGKTRAWPANWPNLNSPETKKSRGHYTIYLPSRHFGRFKRLFGKSHTVRLDGKQFSMAYRFPLPQERRWWDAHYGEVGRSSGRMELLLGSHRGNHRIATFSRSSPSPSLRARPSRKREGELLPHNSVVGGYPDPLTVDKLVLYGVAASLSCEAVLVKLFSERTPFFQIPIQLPVKSR